MYTFVQERTSHSLVYTTQNDCKLIFILFCVVDFSSESLLFSFVLAVLLCVSQFMCAANEKKMHFTSFVARAYQSLTQSLGYVYIGNLELI